MCPAENFALQRTPASHGSDVGLVFALGIESGRFVDQLRRLITIRGKRFSVREGTLKKRQVAVIESGPGQRAATAATEMLIVGHRPDWIISAGFAGALDERLRVGDIVVADYVAGEDGRQLAIDLQMDANTLPVGVHLGRMLTVDRIIRLPKEKAQLGRDHDALAVDMESMAVAEVCRDQKFRFMAIRAISDAADHELPRDLERLMNQQTTARRVGAALGALVHRPSTVKDLWTLRENASIASRRLATFLESVICQLMPETPGEAE